MDIKAVRDALATTISAGIAAGGRGVSCYGRHPGSPKLPAIIVSPGSPYLVFNETWARHGVHTFRLSLKLYAAGRTEDAQIVLDELLSYGPSQPSSIANALRDDNTLGGAVLGVRVINVDGPEPADNGADALMILEITPLKETA